MKASERTVRDWREAVAEVEQRIHDLIAPVEEGFARLPAEPLAHLQKAAIELGWFDRAMAKLDGDQRAL